MNTSRKIALTVFSMLTLRLLPAFGADEISQPFIHYFDCLRTTKTPVDVDVFMKVHGEAARTIRSASDYTKGVDIDLILNEKKEILGLRLLPDKSFVTAAQLKAGLQFGVMNKTFHTIELSKDFDPRRGGTLTMGVLAKVSAKTAFHIVTEGIGNHLEPDADLRQAQKKHPELGLSEKLGRHYNSSKKTAATAQWIEEKFEVKKVQDQWTLVNSKGQPVDTVFVEMKIPSANFPFVLGLEKIKSVQVNTDFSCSAQKPEKLALADEHSDPIEVNLKAKSKGAAVDCKRD